MPMPRIKLSIVFESGAQIGPETAALLGGIRKTGSISAAAREMGIPYKRAWLLLDGMNRAFKEPVIEAATGGAGGGGANLTPFGADVLERYRRMLVVAEAAAREDLEVLGCAALADVGPKI
jgi:molybdate transport system regulatory protein